MGPLSLDLRRRIVNAYNTGLTYEQTAERFGVGRATVSRLLRRFRETGSVEPSKMGGNNPRRVDLAWLRQDAVAKPDARIVDRITAWKAKSGVRVSYGCMWNSLRAAGLSHKKRHPPPGSAAGQM